MVELSLLEPGVMPTPEQVSKLSEQGDNNLPATRDPDRLLSHLLDEGRGDGVTDLDRVVCFLVARGSTYEQACEQVGLRDKKAASQMAKRPELFQLVLKIQTALQLPLGEQIRALAPIALQRKMELILFSKNEAVVNSATSYILDQAEGKAVQKVEVQSFNLNAKSEAKEVEAALTATEERLRRLEAERKKIQRANAPELEGEAVDISD